MVNSLFTCLILIPLAVNYFTLYSGLYQKLDKWIFYRIHSKNVKWRLINLPLISCNLCMAFHVTWISLLLEGNRDIFQIILLAFSAGSMAFILGKIGR